MKKQVKVVMLPTEKSKLYIHEDDNNELWYEPSEEYSLNKSIVVFSKV